MKKALFEVQYAWRYQSQWVIMLNNRNHSTDYDFFPNRAVLIRCFTYVHLIWKLGRVQFQLPMKSALQPGHLKWHTTELYILYVGSLEILTPIYLYIGYIWANFPVYGRWIYFGMVLVWNGFPKNIIQKFMTELCKETLFSHTEMDCCSKILIHWPFSGKNKEQTQTQPSVPSVKLTALNCNTVVSLLVRLCMEILETCKICTVRWLPFYTFSHTKVKPVRLSARTVM